MTAREPADGLLLAGLNGNNPLAYLAAIGVLRIVSLADPDEAWRMRWTENGGGWSPVLSGKRVTGADDLIALLDPALKKMKDHSALAFADDTTKIPCEKFRELAEDAREKARPEDRIHADFIAAFGCESIPVSEKDDSIRDTALRTMSGAGHQHFVGFMRELVDNTEPDDLRASLFESWTYPDPAPSLRWDPVDDRRYALRWKEPSKDRIGTMRGANRLAIEALPMFPTVPNGSRLDTTGFSQQGRATYFSWSIWSAWTSLDTLRSLLALSLLQTVPPDRARLRKMGVVEIYRSERITNGKYRNFATAFSA